MVRNIRRVVTGHGPDGKSRVVFDGPGGGVAEAGEFLIRDLWVTDRAPASNEGGRDSAGGPVQIDPPPHGAVFRIAEVAPMPAGQSAEQAAEAAAALFQNIGGAQSQVDTQRHPQMHRTATVDCIIVLAGRITLILDEGEVELGPHDVLVQRGTNHAWVNKGPDKAVLAAVMIDAEPLP